MQSHLPPLTLYNTKSRAKEILRPLQEGHVKLYTCGPTVYNFAHIGNFRTYIFEDLLRRSLQFFGLKVTQVMNLTDVDDKTIRGAIAGNTTLNAFTQPFKDAFFQDLHTLNIEPAEHYPAATDFIPQMISLIESLLEKGVAYRGGDGSIYYAIRQFPHYGCLSHLHLDELQAGASHRVNSDEYEKESIADFVLWKHYDQERDGQIFWESPFGPGRPGWHLECSAMAMSILGPTLDIHVGGVDNMFPHHENEIAQSEAHSGQTFVNLWMHAEHLVVDHKKMSKSAGNFYTLRDLLNRGYSGLQVRYLLLQTHYKTQLNFTLAGLDGAKTALQRLDDFIVRLKNIKVPGKTGAIQGAIEIALRDFATALADDLNISVALAALFELVRQGNTLSDANQMGADDAEHLIETLKRLDRVLGVMTFESKDTIPDELQELLLQRQQARKERNWKQADSLRDEILAKGYLIEDGAQGARLKKV